MAYGCVNVPGVTPDELAEVRRKGSYYGVCSTDGNTAAKTVTVDSSFVLEDGAEVTVKFENNSSGNPSTLNINATGAKKIYHKGSILQTSTTIPNGVYYFICAGSIHTFRYNSSGDGGNGCWELAGDLYNPVSPVSNVTAGLVYGLEVKFNGQTQDVFMGNANKSINITPSAIGAAEYETGIWTPEINHDIGSSLAEISAALSTGMYTKIGRLVYLKGYVALSAATDKTELYIKGLPFVTVAPYNNPLRFMCLGKICTSVSTSITSVTAVTMSPRVMFSTEEIIQFRNNVSGAKGIFIDIVYSI